MAEGDPRKQLSQVVPLLVAALVCDVAVEDPTTGKPNLIGIFDNVNVVRFPTQRPLYLFVKLADAEGYYDLSVKYVRVSTGEMLAEAQGSLQAADRLSPSSMLIQFPPLAIPDAGIYEFQVWANSAFLGAATLTARTRQAPSAGE